MTTRLDLPGTRLALLPEEILRTILELAYPPVITIQRFWRGRNQRRQKSTKDYVQSWLGRFREDSGSLNQMQRAYNRGGLDVTLFQEGIRPISGEYITRPRRIREQYDPHTRARIFWDDL